MKIIFTDRKGANAIWSIIYPVAEALMGQGHEVFFCRLNDETQRNVLPFPIGGNAIDINVPERRCRTGLFSQHKAFCKQFRQIVKTIRPSVVHTNFAIPAIAARFIAWQEKVPFIVSTQHEICHSMNLLLRSGVRLSSSLPDATIYVSQTVARSFGADDASVRISKDQKLPGHFVIYNGIDMAEIEKIRKEVTEREPYKLVCAGRMVAVKGQRCLIEAMPAILNRFPKAKLVFAGSGPEESALKKRVRDLKTDRQVEFRGWLSREDTLREMATAAGLVVPNAGNEGFGLVVAEGMAAQTPVVASNVSVFKEVLGNGKQQSGWFFEKNSPGALAETVGQLFSSPEEARIRAFRARRRVRERFSTERMVDGYLRIYEALAASADKKSNRHRRDAND